MFTLDTLKGVGQGLVNTVADTTNTLAQGAQKLDAIQSGQSLPAYGVVLRLEAANINQQVEYGRIDAQVRGQTRFFAAASVVSQALANTDIPFGSRFAVSGPTKDFLSTIGNDLQQMNSGIAASIQNGSLGGEGLDSRIVHVEQTKVQGSLDQLRKSDRSAYRKVVEDSNVVLNRTGAMRFAATRFVTDEAHMKVLDGVRKDLGRSIDFSRQSDREAIGNAPTQPIRQTGGCDVAGDKLRGCR